jgi:hypothetical protein
MVALRLQGSSLSALVPTELKSYNKLISIQSWNRRDFGEVSSCIQGIRVQENLLVL